MAVTIDDALLKAANLDEYEFKLEIAIALFAQGRMTLAQASRFVGMSYMDFQALLSDREICVHYDFDDFRQDIQTLEQLSRIWLSLLTHPPFFNLERIGRLNILQSWYTEIVIPEAVFHELSVPGGMDFRDLDWLKVRRAINRQLLDELTGQRDAGEAEAIALATELNADLLLIDEKRGRAFAISKGIRVTGLASVLIEAKQSGLLV